ncbi:ATP-grasp domain-containing protein [Streptomyces chartreusis]|uniref:ATP-grasp domain-containing protein n=1 Tax=Streptomyces chartreusis TaxID=1969 RepID=A0A7H8TBE7_STRCX|nr:ATP-grasp domain-containing protein [Streptomyces chartreusis]QKZ20318.1 ATP-grasp domain-containing protein [Streptomyces chartreusis]
MPSTDSSARATRPVLLLGAGSRPYREHLLQRISAVHPVVLADSEPSSWATPYLCREVAVDLADSEALAVAVKQLNEETALAGISTYMEHHVEAAAHLAERFGLPGTSPASAAACRDKARTRQLFAERGVASARSHLVADEDAAVEAARSLGYPVVVKPRAMGGSAGVVRADSDAEVREAFQRASWETVLGLDTFAVRGVLVEEYLNGTEISAETVVLGPADVRIAAITRKRLGAEPRFQEVGHLVDAADPLLGDTTVTRTVVHAVQALGIERGVLHVELRLTAHGPVLIEVNARPGGDLIPHLVRLASGIDLAQAAVSLATGAVPDLTPSHRRAAAVQFLYPPGTGVVTHLSTPAALRFERWLDRMIWTRHPGDQVTAPPHASIDDRLAHWVVTGTDQAECDQRIAQVFAQVNARVDDAAHTTACTR